MKKIISGKVYDTQTAKELGSWQNEEDCRGFGWIGETLYQKKTGEFFLHGEGGAATRYAHQTERSNWAGGERIMPMSYEEARQWAEEHLDAHAYEAIFGEVAEDDSRVPLFITVSKTAADKARREAARLGVLPAAYIEGLILADDK